MLALPWGTAPRALLEPAEETGTGDQGTRVSSESLAGLPPLPDDDGPSAPVPPGSPAPDRAGWQAYPRLAHHVGRRGASPRVASPAEVAEQESDEEEDDGEFGGFMPGLFD